MLDRKIYSSLDIMKFIMAMLILTQHTCNEWAHSTGLVHAFFGLGNFAVPFFFACSGFLFFTKLNNLDLQQQNDYYKNWSIRIGKMYLVWSLIYFLFVFAHWIEQGFCMSQILRYVHRSVVFSTYATIWFLPALWIGVSLCYLLKKTVSKKAMCLIILLLLIVGNLFGSYTNVITSIPSISLIHEAYMDVFITWRNGFFNGTPYVFIGILLADGFGRNISRSKSFLFAILFGILFLFEAFSISKFSLSSATDMGFMMFPAIFFIMNVLINTDITQKRIWTHLRNLSMLVFLGQRLFLTAIPGILPRSVSEKIISWPDPIIFLFFIVLVLAFSFLIERLSERHKIFKILW